MSDHGRKSALNEEPVVFRFQHRFAPLLKRDFFKQASRRPSFIQVLRYQNSLDRLEFRILTRPKHRFAGLPANEMIVVAQCLGQ